MKIKKDTVAGSGPVPRYHGLRPAVQVSVALSTLLGLDEQPGDLDGHGPIPAAVARRIDGGWQVRRLDDGTVEWTSPTGHTYRVPPATYPIDTTSQQAEGQDQNEHPSDPHHPGGHSPSEDRTDHGDEPAAEDKPPF